MHVSQMNWMMVEEYLKRDDRCVLPLGSTEQHAYLSLSVDSILAERIAVEAAEPLGVPVFPVLAYGITPYFRAFPGSITLRIDTHLATLDKSLRALDLVVNDPTPDPKEVSTRSAEILKECAALSSIRAKVVR